MNRPMLAFFYVVYTILVFFAGRWLAVGMLKGYGFSLFLVAVLALVVPAGVIIKHKVDIFEPVLLFSVIYYSAVVSAFSLLYNNFQERMALSGAATIASFNNVLIWLIVGYIFFCLGYHPFITKQQIRYTSFGPSNVPKPMLKVIAFVFIAISLGWFVYTAKTLSGNLLAHLQKLSILRSEYRSEGLSTALYQIGYAGMYLWFYIWLQTRKHSFLLILCIIITSLMSFSTGRITLTVTYVLSFVVLFRYSIPLSPKNIRKTYLIAPAIVSVGILMYLFRLSSFQYTKYGMKDNLWEIFQTLLFTGDGLQSMVEGANLLSIATLMTILSSWEDRVGFLWGESLLWSILNCIPPTIRELLGWQEDVPRVAMVIKQTWYMHDPCGGLPPSLVGEFFVNFGYIGIPVGMFLYGMFCAFIYNTMQKQRNYWVLLIYTAILTRFSFTLSRGSFSDITGVFWMAVPTLVIVCLLAGIKILLTQKVVFYKINLKKGLGNAQQYRPFC